VKLPRWLPLALAGSVGLLLATFLLIALALDDDPVITTDNGRPVGFEVATLRSTQPDGSILEWCVWHADTSDQRSQGLQKVSDLGEPIGMAFTYDTPVGSSYHMYNTEMPLSIAWFGEDNGFVGATDMVPCEEDDISNCARYSPGAGYALAVEVASGDLPTYGLVPGSAAELLDQPCP
jgi:uncharacterized membrane protein (UPF0127 family)